MQRQAGVLFATTVLIFCVLAGCRTHTASEEDDKKAAINVVLAHELACQTYDFDKEDSLHTPDARVIEESYPHPLVTGPSFCTTVNEKVYITTSSGKGAKGGSQGAVGDRRATLCGAKVAGAGGL